MMLSTNYQKSYQQLQQKYRYVRSGFSKASVFMTLAECIIMLIVAFVFLFSGLTYMNSMDQIIGMEAADGTVMTEELIVTIAQEYLILAMLLLVFGIWSVVVWIICWKSKTRKRRDIICTYLGRIPILLIVVYCIAVGNVSAMVITLIFWAFLCIAFSYFGWTDNPDVPHIPNVAKAS